MKKYMFFWINFMNLSLLCSSRDGISKLSERPKFYMNELVEEVVLDGKYRKKQEFIFEKAYQDRIRYPWCSAMIDMRIARWKYFLCGSWYRREIAQIIYPYDVLEEIIPRWYVYGKTVSSYDNQDLNMKTRAQDDVASINNIRVEICIKNHKEIENELALWQLCPSLLARDYCYKGQTLDKSEGRLYPIRGIDEKSYIAQLKKDNPVDINPNTNQYAKVFDNIAQ